MPGLVRGMARTAAVVGTATATRNAVNRRQADKNMAAYSQAAANQAPPPQQYAPPPEQYAPPPAEYYEPPAPQDDMITQLERLGALKAQGLLTEEEFAAQKAKLLGM
ncbi:MAG TPA: SHOCT domain-containing protein [Chloroflexota bacterium]|nr:SHOCT domain-containing protein [Chloroflexota bacterium]HUM70801.1 SHOCT domain-containing protein [Chloroflexota bacterium]